MVSKKKITTAQVTTPIRKKPALLSLSERILPYFPQLDKKLAIAGMEETSAVFVEKCIKWAGIFSILLLIITIVALYLSYTSMLYAIPIFVIYFCALFFYSMKLPDLLTIRKKKNIDREIVFAGRQLSISVSSGMPLFESMLGLTEGYGELSDEISKIVDKVTLGTPLTHALREVANTTPSTYLKRILTHLANSITSGANISSAMEDVLNQISREQVIALKEYGQKLNPLIMFYMIFGIIFPSLGVAFLIILLSIVGGGTIGVSSTSLVFVGLFIAILQFLFLAMVETSRPNFLL